MRNEARRKRAVVQQMKRHGELSGPLNRSAKRALQLTRVSCPECQARVLAKRLTDHYLAFHADVVEDNREEA